MDRKTFIKTGSLATAGTILGAPYVLRANKKVDNTIRIGFIGTGLRGRNHVSNILDYEGVECPVICDIDPEAVKQTQKIFEEKGLESPKVYSEHERSYEEMLEKEDLDGVIMATDWKWHTPICIKAMEEGIYVGSEVSGAFSVEECWELVNTHQRTGTHLMFLENVCYRRDVMAVLNMVRDDVFGELLHFRGGYLHDLRAIKFNDGEGGLAFGEGSGAYGEARWRTNHSKSRNADLYPTHGLGPIGTMADMNRGNRLTSISSVATKSRSLKNYIKEHPKGGEDHPYYDINWELGDIVTSTIQTARGETIILTHDTNTARPYSLGFRVQGVNGLTDFDYHTRRIYVEGKSDPHRWDDAAKWLEKYDHHLWKKYAEIAEGGGHGGMDYFLDRAFVESVRQEKAPVLDVYDGAVLRSITPLSQISIQNGGAQSIPDFTEGQWVTREPIFGIGEL